MQMASPARRRLQFPLFEVSHGGGKIAGSSYSNQQYDVSSLLRISSSIGKTFN